MDTVENSIWHGPWIKGKILGLKASFKPKDNGCISNIAAMSPTALTITERRSLRYGQISHWWLESSTIANI